MKTDPLTVSELLDLVEETFDSWMQLLESAQSDRMDEPGVSGDWSLKDIIAHITWHEEQMIEVMKTHALVGSKWWQLPTHERNARIYDEYKSAALSDVLDHAIAMHEQLIHWIGTLKDADLNEPNRFEGMPEDWLFGDILAQNTYLHYGDHAAAIAKWLTKIENRA